ncbi:FMN-binding protein [Ilumatobacter sp.]|uniref:FMN-binding protein n=1 Tax=Ilumatobacter sp. TaxID=1967498 RepID=UPI003AF4E4CA
MDRSPPSSRPPGSDPLLVPPAPDHLARRMRPGTDSRPSDEGRHAGGRRPPRPRHPARGARAVALTASVVATGAVAAALAYSEGAWSADDDPVAADSSPTTTNDASGIAASDSTPEITTAPTPSTTAATTTTPDTTEPVGNVARASGYADGIYSGTAEYTEWGDVQVRVTVADGVIVDVEAIQYPTGRRSSAINDEAIPMLEADALALQTADLDVVSGATYTSWTYAASLQAALDRAAAATTQAEDTA